MIIKRKSIWLLAFLGFSLPAQAADIKQGKVIYDRLCIHCHLTTYDDKFGPGLAGITERRTETWLHEFLQNPRQMIKHDDYAKNLKENNTYNLTMPTLPEMQDRQKRLDVIAFMSTLAEE